MIGYEMPSRLKTRGLRLYPTSINTAKGVKWGYINSKGQIVLKTKYDSASDFQGNGLAIVMVKDDYGIINISGQYVVKPKYFNVSEFADGLATVADSKGFKVIDEGGK